MYAGERMRFLHPLRIGDEATLAVETVAAAAKRGRAGDIIVTTQKHTVSGPDGVATEAERDMLYIRPAPGADRAHPQSRPAPAEAAWQRTVETSTPLLFRFSAVTFNPHRIHYDHPYATGAEGFPGLVVHGPLTMILLMELARDHGGGRTMTEFHMRATAPLFAGPPVRLFGNPGEDGASCELWAATPDGRIAMAAGAGFA
jgi:3-methylfumaryl-CoA hydratase